MTSHRVPAQRFNDRSPARRTLFRTAAIALALAFATAGAVRADPFHAQTLPLGQRALGMGGAFTAVASDPSTTYYNPAGTVTTSDSALSASLTVVAFDRSTVKGGFRTANGHSSLDHNVTASLPVFVSAVKQLGRRGADGRRRHALALSTYTVDQRRLSFDVEVRSPIPTGMNLATLSISSSDRTTWHTLTYAYRASPRLSFGYTGILSVRRTYYTEERIGVALGDLNPDGSYVSDSATWTSYKVKTNVKTLLGRIGLLYRFENQLRLGVMFQPPSFHVRGTASVRERSLRDQLVDAPGSFFTASEGNLKSRSPTPWELRVGAAYPVRDWVLLAIDASVYGPTGSKQKPIVAVGPRKPDPQTGATADAGNFIDERWYRRWSGNVSIGGELTLAEAIAIRAGLYTDLSSAPRVPRTTSTYQSPNVHRLGGALSVGMVNDGYDISLGAIGIWGRGKGLSYNVDPEGDSVYRRTQVTDRMFLVFLHGVRSAVKALAQKTEEKLRSVLAPNAEALEPVARPEPRK